MPARTVACGYWNGRAGDVGARRPGQILHGAEAAACWRRGPRAQRKPLFWFRFSALFLFRFADRRFSAGLLKEPPRSTRQTDKRSSDLTR